MMAGDAVHCRLLHLVINNKTYLESNIIQRTNNLMLLMMILMLRMVMMVMMTMVIMMKMMMMVMIVCVLENSLILEPHCFVN